MFQPGIKHGGRLVMGAWIGAMIGCAAPSPVPFAQPAPVVRNPEAGANVEAKSSEPAAAPVPPAVAEGASLFKTRGCIMCHGEAGKGGVRNRYSQGEYVPALENVASGYSEDELKEKIRKGVSSVAKADPNGPVPILIMPSWEDKLTPEELDRIVAYLFSLAPKSGGDKDGF